MKILRFFLLSTFILASYYGANAQDYKGKSAANKIPGTDRVYYANPDYNPEYIHFSPGNEVALEKMDPWLQSTFHTNSESTWKLIGRENDALGNVHFRYQQCWHGKAIRDAIFILHTKNNQIYSWNGTIYSEIQCSNSLTLSEQQALQSALDLLNADSYMWEIPIEESNLRLITGDENATYYPQGELCLVPVKDKHSFVICWKFDIYSSKPLFRKDVYINAQTGLIELSLDRINTTDVPGTAVTKYSGTKNITTDSTAPGSYRLRETGRGNGISTYDMNQGTNYGSAVDFTDSDNYWNNVNANQDEIAGDAHWGTEVTYDYYWIEHGRNSIDDNGFALVSYVHYDNSYANAFWDGQRMTYGDGDGSYSPFTALDVCAHEITHGLTSFTANLDYVDESGALSEGFSDIFGTAAEFYGKPLQANWNMGEDIGVVLRNISNPSATGNPDTYLGNDWDPGQEVHQNSTVCSHWFYRLSQGGSGTNDNGDAFSITGQGLSKAASIAFRTLTVYLTSTSGYEDARFYSIISASDLYGGCSAEVEATTNAWYAVGVGNIYVASVIPDYTANFTSLCSAPVSINFSNHTLNANTYLWDFGDGGTSTLVNPSHTYLSTGDYTVTLYADGGACGQDSLARVAFISIQTNNSAIASMPMSGDGMAQNCCSGTLYDSGGDGDYQNNTTSTITIAPSGATSVVLYFTSFAFESGYDYLYIYDGPSTASPLIGQYDGFSLPSGGTITSTGSSITLRQVTDPGVVESGFELNWMCNYPNAAPLTQFTANTTESCTGLIQFSDQSANAPNNWLWDFGDGSTSTQQNPIHHFVTNGTFTVQLTVSNGFGADSLLKINYITVNMPPPPTVIQATICDSSTATLSANGAGQCDWYDALVGGTFLYTGNTYITPTLYTTTTFYVEDNIVHTPQHVGKVDNSGSGGFFGSTSNIHYQIFDCYTPLTLVSVKVYADGAGNRTILLRDSAMNTLQQLSVYVPDGESRVTLNFDLPLANNLQLVGDGAPDLFRNNNGSATYPYTLSGLLSITESSASLPPYSVTGNYYYFYDWEVSEPTCTSPRVPVIATVVECTGMEEMANIENLTTGPNPCTDQFSVQFNTAKQQNLEMFLYDIRGRLLFSASEFATAGQNLISLNMKKYPKGVYLLEIRTNNLTIPIKVVKQ